MRALLDRHWLIDAEEITVLHGGMNSQTWEVTSRTDRWVLKLVPPHTPPGFRAGLFAAAVWAYPAPVRAKAVGTLIGISLLYLVNLVRVLSLIAIGVLARGWFDVAHLYVWQAIFFAVVAGCWFGWILRLPSKT